MPPINLETTLVPLTLLIMLGWCIGKAQDIDLKSIATILVFTITPMVALGSTAQLQFHGSYVLLPFISGVMATFSGMTSFGLGRLLLKHKDDGYLLPQATGSGNNGYYGLPLAMALFPPDQVGVYFLIMLGTTLFEVTLGYYFVGRGHLTVADAFRRVVKMPSIYAITLGLILSAQHVTLDPGLLKLWDAARGAYVVFGMMIIGIALAKHKKLAWHWDFIALSALGKYILWAVAVISFAWLDGHVLHIFSGPIYTMMAILAITPCAANTAAFAAQHDFKSQLAATVVFFTTIVSFAGLPLALPLIFTFSR
jgi:predicted permease